MHNVLAVANYFFLRARSEHIRDLSPAKMHGLLYLAQGWHLAETGRPLFDARVSANRDSAFIPSLREAGCWGTKAMADFVSVLHMDEARGVMVERKPMLPPRAPVTALLDWVWKNYARLPQFELVKSVNAHGGPWDMVWNDEKRADDAPRQIPVETLRAWFKDLRSGKRNTTTGRRSDTKRKERTQRSAARHDPDRLRSA